jgi:hypothetical protein
MKNTVGASDVSILNGRLSKWGMPENDKARELRLCPYLGALHDTVASGPDGSHPKKSGTQAVGNPDMSRDVTASSLADKRESPHHIYLAPDTNGGRDL